MSMIAEVPPALLASYAAQIASDLQRAQDAVDHQRFDDLRKLGHRLAGTAPMYGLQSIGECAERLQECARRGEAAEANQIVKEMRAIAVELDGFLRQ